MKNALRVLLGVVVTALCGGAAVMARPETPISLADLSKLPRIQARCIESAWDEQEPVRQEIGMIAIRLKVAPVAQRARVLRGLCRWTRWGTPERSAAYYVSAWYGVDYVKRRDYLLNVVFFPREASDYPYGWGIFGAGGMELLFGLHEHNYDFCVLHRLLIEHAGDHLGEVIDAIKADAFRKHPRGVIHAAAMSERCRGAVTDMMRGDGPLEETESEGFLAYCRKVARDRTDPLNAVARRLLKDAKEEEKKGR